MRFPCVFGEFNSLFSRLLSFSYPFGFYLLFHSTDDHTYVLRLGVVYLAYSYIHTYAVTVIFMMMIMMIIIIIIIDLRNKKRHNRHSYLSKPNIRTIKSRKINLGDKFYVRKKQDIALV